MITLFAVIYFVYFTTNNAFAQYAGCDYLQKMTVGQSYDVFSPGFGQNKSYPPGTNCRWTAVAPSGYRINVNCFDLQLSQSSNGNLDRLEISYTGSSNLNDAQIYTNNQPFAYSTYGNQVVMALRSSKFSKKGGKFLCSLTTTGIPSWLAPTNYPSQSLYPSQIPATYPNQPLYPSQIPATYPYPSQSIYQPPPQISPSLNPSQSIYYPQNNQYCSCGQRSMQTRIVGGTISGINEFTMMAGLVLIPYTQIFCGATIISNNYALTSAHCLLSKYIQNVGLLVGEHDYETGSDTLYSQVLPLVAATSNPGYNERTYDNDIAIVQTATQIQFNQAVGPVCLPFRFSQQNNMFTNYYVEALGWGMTSFGGPVSNVLKKAKLRVTSEKECKVYFPIHSTQMCTYSPGNDTCQMDSGGPLLYTTESNGIAFLTGIISFGQGCGTKYPGVSVRVTSYLNWIIQNTPGANYCYQ